MYIPDHAKYVHIIENVFGTLIISGLYEKSALFCISFWVSILNWCVNGKEEFFCHISTFKKILICRMIVDFVSFLFYKQAYFLNENESVWFLQILVCPWLRATCIDNLIWFYYNDSILLTVYLRMRFFTPRFLYFVK